MKARQGASHLVFATPLDAPVVDGHEVAYFAMGCFWGAERCFWLTPGVVTTCVGYAGGHTKHPTYHAVCTGASGHAEVVRVVYDPNQVSYAQLLAVFFESHDPTTPNRQGNDVGSQYRSAIFTTTPAQLELAEATAAAYSALLFSYGRRAVVTEISPAGPFTLAEAYHQQYLAANPLGYCGLEGTHIACPVLAPSN